MRSRRIIVPGDDGKSRELRAKAEFEDFVAQVFDVRYWELDYEDG